jgi:hypothetical protein
MYRYIIILTILILSACTTPGTAPPTDIALLEQWESVAAQRLQGLMDAPRLRQVDTDLERYTFHYVDAVGAISYAISMPTPKTPVSEWEVVQTNDFRLINNPDPEISLGALQVSPHEVADAMTREWQGCHLSGLTLYFDTTEQDLMWTGFCTMEGGVVTGSISNRTRTFVPVNALPASPPSTATPL